MIALLRPIMASSAYRHLRDRLHRREPDDVWYDAGVGWIITFGLVGPRAEQLALFVVSQPEPGTRAALVRALEVSHDTEQAEVQLLDSS